jgi:hypothetical protein
MKRPVLLATVMSLALGAAALQAGEGEVNLGAEASIPFVNSGNAVRDWQADGIDGLWVQDAHKQWYYATFIGPCHGLDFALRVGFENRAMDTLDRFSTVVVPGEGRCAIQSFTKSEAPPKRKDKGKGKDVQAE